MVDWCKYSLSLNQRQDEKGQLLTQEKITAMARLCYEAGAAAGTRYGCDKSSAWIADQPGRDMLDGLRTELFYDSETMVIGIKPICSLGAALSGHYTAGSFPFFYVDQNASGENAHFAAGVTVQFLAGTKTVCMGNANACMTWSSSEHAKTVLHANGNSRQGIKLAGGKIVLRHKGGIRFLRGS